MKKLLGVFLKKNCKKEIKENSEQKTCLNKKAINCMSNGKSLIINLEVGLIKKTSYKNELLNIVNKY